MISKSPTLFWTLEMLSSFALMEESIMHEGHCWMNIEANAVVFIDISAILYPKLAGIICPTPSLFHISLLTRRRLLFLDRLDQHSDGTNSIHHLLHTLDKRIKYCVNFPEKPPLFRNNWKAPRQSLAPLGDATPDLSLLRLRFLVLCELYS
jgi:hypothetical protein